ncbi:hypothetical protein F2Q69_00009751 [Brassica cretica]|uniref:Uncharacterized protein n=1 Tax=Brassica cretica TaxID=69181 RepID=A0A8S9NUJ8_BRACR|nr:hypothetical protein F2Q69_00009751 [Brassica cretica]
MDRSRIVDDKRKVKALIKNQLPIVGNGNMDPRRFENAPKTASKAKKVPSKERVPTDRNQQEYPRSNGMHVISQSSRDPTATGSDPTLEKLQVPEKS